MAVSYHFWEFVTDTGTVIVEKMNTIVANQVMVIHYHEVPKDKKGEI